MLIALHNAIVAGINAAVPLQPAQELEVKLASIDSANPSSTGQLTAQTRWTARVLVEEGQADADLQVRDLAASVAVAVNEASRFGQLVGPAKVLRIGEDAALPRPAGYLAWTVEWTHEVDLGQSAWEGTGILPSQVYLGHSPDIGPGHEPDYTEVTGG